MATQRSQIDEQTVAPTADPRNVPLPNDPLAPKSNIDASEACVITPDDIEKKREKIRESERQAWFQNAVNKRLNIPNGYLKVAVLVVRWHDEIDGFRKGHDEEIRKLKHLFCDRFRYEYKEIKLETTKKPQHKLNLAIMQHVLEHDGPNNLLIVYYTGHGRLKGPSTGEQRLELSATASAHSTQKDRYPATAFWDDAELPLLKSAEADVLAILDCCFASNAQKGYIEDRRAYELLAASPMNQTTRAPGPESFTTLLIKSLKGLLAEYKNQNFTTTKLLEKMNMNRNPPSMLWDRLHKHERHVQLAPLEKDKQSSQLKEQRFSSRPPEEAWVKLRFSLPKALLSQARIEDLARELPSAFERAKILGLRRIDWLKMEMMESSSPRSLSLPGVATSAVAMQRLRRKSQTLTCSTVESHVEGSPTPKRPRISGTSPTSTRQRSSAFSTKLKDDLRSSSETFASPVSDTQSGELSA